MEIDREAIKKPTLLVVDDTPDNLALISELLTGSYHLKLANNGNRALKLASTGTLPDLILLDIMMPEMDGYEVLQKLKSDPLTREIPVIFLTAKIAVEDEERGLALGAVDYLGKPISPPILMARIKNHLALKAQRDFLSDKAAFLAAEVDKRTREVVAVQDVTILALASLAETRDSDTGNHIRRTQHYVKALAEHLQKKSKFAGIISDSFIRVIFKSAPLHDIGKVGIPDRILLKPGKLDPAEFEIMKTHTLLGRDAIEQAEKELGIQADFLSMAKEIALSHQEKWDGSGYPEGLAGTAIPLSARMMALADVFDALISRRVYKEPMPIDKAIEIIELGKGAHFDPDLVEAFLEIQDQFLEIATRYADTDQDIAAKAAQLEKLRESVQNSSNF
jgi:putative two-component system response regulator